MAQANSADVVDSLFVSLGIDLDDKSFKAATNTVNGLKSGLVQLGAAAGTGIGFSSATFGLANKIQELERLGKITNFTTKQIEGLQFALKKVGVSDDSAAYSIVQKIPSLQQAAREGRLNDQAYWNGAFNPQQFSNLSGQDAIEYLVESYSRMNTDQQRILRGGIGIGDNDPLTRLLETGTKGFKEINEQFERMHKSIDPALSDNAKKLNDELSVLSLNFENLKKAIGGDLIGPLASFTAIINDLMQKYPDEAKYGSYAAGIGGTAVVWKALGALFGKQAATSFGGGLLAHPVIATILGIIAPGNAFVEKEDAQAMSDPIKNWQKRNPGKELPSGVVDWKEQYLQQLEGGGKSKNESDFLNLISQAEGTSKYANNGYNTLFGGSQFSDYSDHPRQYFDHNGTRTSAAGRYQITAQSWDDAVKALGLTDFSPANQDKAALWLAQRAGQGENIRNGNITGAANGLRQVWTGLNSSAGNDALAGYYASANRIPQTTHFPGGTGSRPVTTNNNVVINAGGANADEVADIVFGQISDKTSQATAHLATDKF
ncbi:glycoside hydrolase family 24 protein [Mangrovibacter phragmitis]|uniref:glycoside hydrolase family 24 protein n=1 Tax=Mangrovibacter phragmitis TaxID=1691903 RepID=UPI003515D94C